MKRFLEKYFFRLLFMVLILALNRCTQPINLKNMAVDEPGYFMYGKIPQRTFYENREIGEIVEKWNNETSGSHSTSSVLVYNNTVFVSDLSGRIYAFDRQNGKLLGYEKFNGSIDVAPVLYKLRLIFVLNERVENYSTLIVFDILNGKVLSEEKIDGGVPNELILLEDGVAALTDKGELIKFDLIGNRLWSVATKSGAFSSPASDGKKIIVGNQNGEIIFISSSNGEIEFKINFNCAITSGLIIENNNVFFADNSGVIYSYNLIERKINWLFNTGFAIIATPALDNSSLFIGNLNGDLFSLDKLTGKVNWKIGTKGLINITPLITNNLLVQPNVDKKVFLINPSNGVIENTLEFERRTKLTPVLFDSLLFIGSDRGILHAYQVYGLNK